MVLVESFSVNPCFTIANKCSGGFGAPEIYANQGKTRAKQGQKKVCEIERKGTQIGTQIGARNFQNVEKYREANIPKSMRKKRCRTEPPTKTFGYRRPESRVRVSGRRGD